MRPDRAPTGSIDPPNPAVSVGEVDSTAATATASRGELPGGGGVTPGGAEEATEESP